MKRKLYLLLALAGFATLSLQSMNQAKNCCITKNDRTTSSNTEQKVQRDEDTARNIELVNLPGYLQCQHDVKKQTFERLELHVEQNEDLKLKAAALEELYERGMKMLNDRRETEAIPYLKLIAQHGTKKQQAIANCSLGNMYYLAPHLQNYTHAHAYSLLAAQQDIWAWAKINASSILALMYYHGHGIKQNYQEAVYYFECCAKQTILPDMKAFGIYNLGILYTCGHGVAQDNKKAREYLKCAMQQKDDVDIQLQAQNALKQLDEQEATKAATH
jgi:TPR repeat protein